MASYGYRQGVPGREIYHHTGDSEAYDGYYRQQPVHPQQGHIAQGFDYGAFPDTQYAPEYEEGRGYHEEEDDIDPQGKVHKRFSWNFDCARLAVLNPLWILLRILQVLKWALQSRWLPSVLCLVFAYSIYTSSKTLLSTRQEAKQLLDQLRQARGHMRRAQADATFARTNAILADEDVKRCQTIKQQIKQALEQAEAEEASCLEKVSSCATELEQAEAKLVKASQQLSNEAQPLKEEQQRIHASIQDLKTFDPSKVKASPAKGATEAKAGAAPKQQQAAQKTQQVSEDLINQAIDAATKSATGSQ